MKPSLSLLCLAFAAVAFPLNASRAEGPYDGNWFVDAGPAGTTGQEQSGGCEAVRIPFMVKDNQITGSLQSSAYGTGRVTEGSGSSGTPISGAVAPDGSFTSIWQSYTAKGKLSADGKAQMAWTGICGPRTATGGRVKEQ
jgi:hypothetical protein